MKKGLPLNDEEESATQALDLRMLGRLFSYTRPYQTQRNRLFVLVFLRAVQLPMMAWGTGAIINNVVVNGSVDMLVWACLAFLLLAAFTDLTMSFRMLLAMNLGESVTRDLRVAVFSHMQRMRMAWFHRTKAGYVISRFTSDIDAVRVGVQDVLFVSMVQMGQMIISATIMIFYDWVLFLVVLALAPTYWAINQFFRRRLSRAHRDVQESGSRVTSNLVEAVNGIRVTQGFVRQDVNSESFEELLQNHATNNMRVARTSGAFVPLLEFNSQIFIAILLLLGGYQVLHTTSDVSVGELILFLFLTNLFFSPIQSLANQYNNALSALAGAERLFRFLDTPPDWEEAPDLPDLPEIQGAVAFENVSFSYAAHDRPVLKSISFSVDAGKTVAFVGHTGSGKSSIINLLTKFYLPDSGTVRVDGYDLREVRGASLQHQSGMVLQQNFLFSGTVMDNIRFPRPNASDEDVRVATDRIGCRDLLEALPDGLRTEVGEAGSRLSLGQRQLVCFARAMLADPRILILDEATSSIDAITEARLQTALDSLRSGRTTFVVAHRLSTIRKADLILVLRAGEIVERGSHATLSVGEGEYAKLYRQFVSSTTEEPS